MDIIKKIPKPIIARNFKKVTLPKSPIKIPRPNINLPKLPQSIQNNIFLTFIVTFIIFVVVGSFIYRSLTKEIATTGGIIKEGIIGQPQYINPVLSFSNDINKPDRVLEYLIYPSLFRLDKTGNLSNELVDSYTVGDNGKEYIFKLKSGINWDDNTPLTIDDIIFTLQTIQNPAYNSPISSALKGVSITRVDDATLKLNLNSSYSPFLSNLTFGILPKHIWQNLEPSAFLLSEANLKPIGAGKFKYKSIQKKKDGNIASITIEKNPNYFGEKPNIENFTLVFYSKEEEMAQDFKQNNLQAITQLKSSLSDSSRYQLNAMNIPQSFGIIFNIKDPLLSNKEIRQSISNAINRQPIINDMLQNQATLINGPLTPFNQYYVPTDVAFDIEKGKKTLDDANWKDIDGDGIREKDNKKAEFTILVANGNKVDEVTKTLQAQIREIGIQMNIELVSFADLSANQIRDRSYQALFLGLGLNIYPDPYIYWHSSQITSPGLNLSQYTNINTDGYLETARTNTDTNVITSSLQQFQQQITSDVPAIFIYSPKYLYYTNPNIKNITVLIGNSSVDRYASISEWYVKTKRVLK
jgi:peptide/nickel transport system substrate-binding protein